MTIPRGTVTLLFSDIEGSTQLLHRLGDRYESVLAEHQAIFRQISGEHSGYEVNTDGDAFFIAFDRAADGIATAVAVQQELGKHQWPSEGVVTVRIGLHTGEPTCTGDDYTGIDVHRAARICAAGHGGQVLLTEATRTLAGSRIPTGVSFRDLGEHRLKDLEKREHLFQLVIPDVRSDFPPIRSLNNCPNNLPAQITSLIGREHQLKEVCELVRRTDVRLVTLTGPGGAGKSLLGLHAASILLADFPDGASVATAADATINEAVVVAIAAALGVEDAGGGLVIPVINHLREKRLLLLIDNLEQAVDAGKLLSLLMEQCANVKIIATSRSPLSIRSEHTFNVPPLYVPRLNETTNPDELLASPSVRLFSERAQAVKGDFAVNQQNFAAVVQICSYLDGLPLAIELAAARVKLLSPGALLARLVDGTGRISLQLLSGGAQDLPARQQTMREAISWSYNLLDSSAKKLFCRLSVFAGGCTLAMAEAIGADLGDPCRGAVDQIGGLIDCNLLRHEEQDLNEPRISMLQTIREFGLEQLRKSRADTKAFMAHAECFANLANTAAANLDGPDYSIWAKRVATEHENFRSALAWSFDSAPDLALHLVASLGEVWFRQGKWSDLLSASERAARIAGAQGLADQAQCLRYAGRCVQVTGQPWRAEEFYAQSLQLSETVGDEAGILHTLNLQSAVISDFRGEIEKASALLQRSRGISDILKNEKLTAAMLFHEGRLDLGIGNFDQAREKFEQARSLHQRRSDQSGRALCESYLATVEIFSGQLERASQYIDSALQRHEALSEKHAAEWDRFKRAQVASLRGQFMQAQTQFEECSRNFALTGGVAGQAWSAYEIGKIDLARGDLPEATSSFERSLSLFRPLGIARAWPAMQLGAIAISEGRFRSGRKLLEKALLVFRQATLRPGLTETLSQLARLARHERDLDCVRSHLEEALSLIRTMESPLLARPVLEQMAYLCHTLGCSEECAVRLGKIDELSVELGLPMRPVDLLDLNELITATNQELGDEAFSRCYAEGRTRDWTSFELEVPVRRQ